MFIYIKTDLYEAEHRYIINKVSSHSGEYFEIAFKKQPSAALLSRAISRCGKNNFPVVYDGALKKKDIKRRFNAREYDIQLLINGFSKVCHKLEKVLLIDPYGEFCERIFLPLCAVKTLYVLSPFKELYLEANSVSLRILGVGTAILENKANLYDFPAVLAPRGISEFYGNAYHPFLFGEGGFMPAGDKVLVRREYLARNLQAALFCCQNDKKAALAIPEFFCRDGLIISPESLKLRLDRSLKRGL